MNEIEVNFKKSMELVESLLTFDDVIIRMALTALEKAQKGLIAHSIDNHSSYNITPLIEQFKNIREHQSVRQNYEIMLNQCVVLQVSYFSSAIEDVFREAFSERLDQGKLGDFANEEIKITIAQICNNSLVDVFLEKKDISFQDMQSIKRSFNRYIGTSINDEDEIIHNIILAQNMRHCIVHSGCKVSRKTENRLKSASLRTIKKVVSEGEFVQFTEVEVQSIKNSMLTFINGILSEL